MKFRLALLSLVAAPLLHAQEATPVSAIKIAKDFRVELLYNVPIASQGSWVSLCFDEKGRLITSDQYGKFYRITPPALDGSPSETKVEEIPAGIGEAQGMCWANHCLYAVTNSDKYPRGLYRISSSKNDDVLDKVEQLKVFPPKGGEHGPHAVIPGPDGKSLYIVSGNQTPLPEITSSRPARLWGEDTLLPRIYGRGFMRDVPAPGNWIVKTDLDGKDWELISTGCRNPYDIAFNGKGDLFTYDADMEWDMSLPWYRPTRVCFVPSGGEFGWRNGSAKFPVRWEDNLPPIYDIGPGSPTGIVFGYGTKFPARYQDALFICDWSYGKMYAMHLKRRGATYEAEREEFLSAQPLPLTDMGVSPTDHALYFTVGGRKVQSGLYRVTYTGKESTEALPEVETNTALSKEDGAHLVRQKLEAFHGKQDPKAIVVAWPYLGDDDRFIRFAARVAIENQPLATWKDKALHESNPRAQLIALMALCRAGGGDKALLPEIIDALDEIDFKALKGIDRETLVRDYALAFCRFGAPLPEPAPETDPANAAKGKKAKKQAAGAGSVPMPPNPDSIDPAIKKKVIAKLSPLFPTKDTWLDVDLAEVLTFLGDEAFLPKAVAIMDTAPTQEEQIAYAKTLRMAKAGWTPEAHEKFFKWICLRAPTYKGGANMDLFVKEIRHDSEKNLTDQEKVALKSVLEAVPDVKAPQFTYTPRTFVKNYEIKDLEGLLGAGLEGNRNFDNGRNLFGAVGCFACHRFNNEGGAVGPDLSTVAGKYSPRDLLRNILDPNLEISDQYAQMEVTMDDGSKVYGRIINMHGDAITLNTNMMDPSALQNVDRKKVKSMELSKVSMMPPGLLNTLKDNDILDLLAYLLSKGNRDDPMFK